MEHLFETSIRRIQSTDLTFTRSLMDEIQWDARLICIKGARGVGKTTLIMQYIHRLLSRCQPHEVVYLSLDNLRFAELDLLEVVRTFVMHGGRYLFLDEVHRYPRWSVVIKNIYDDYPDLKIVFTGSSLLEILNARADLSRRAAVYSLQGLSFREYLNMTQGTSFAIVTLQDLLKNHIAIATGITAHVKPLQFFSSYLQHGYYPYFREQEELYFQRINEVLRLILEIELPQLRGVAPSAIPKLRRLLLAITESAPFIPNISKLSERAGLMRNTLVDYIRYLDEAGVTRSLHRDAKGITRLQKPDKLYLENTNLMFALSDALPDNGGVRETFFLNQASYRRTVEYPETTDFVIDRKWFFEIGGKGKKGKQLPVSDTSYILADDLEIGFGRKIPLWLFGFLY
jgi:predicted AAA+ superfamily ATPase